MNNVMWNQVFLDEFTRLAGLSDLEQDIIKGKMWGHSRIELSMKYNISIATLDRKIAKLKKKYDSVQPYSSILPKRIE